MLGFRIRLFGLGMPLARSRGGGTGSSTRLLSRRLLGCVAVVLVIGVAVLAGLGLQWVAGAVVAAVAGPAWAHLAGSLAIAIVGTTGLAQRSLFDHVNNVLTSLRAGDLAASRERVSLIVGRDTRQLDATGVSAAALESLAESFNDGIVAPAFWFLIAGLPGLFAYKVLNTADSLIGHKEERWRAFGWAAARADDVANLVPARIAGALLVFAGMGGLGVMFSDASKHASPNAGWPEAAMAGALGIRARRSGHIRRRSPSATRVRHGTRTEGGGSRPGPENIRGRLRIAVAGHRHCRRGRCRYGVGCRMAALMIQGCGSDVGKSVLVAGLCRLFTNRGIVVRPFKSQNMSNNAAVTSGGGEIGRAQALQAQACRIKPTVDMNPVLLKPQSDMGAQLIVRGKMAGTFDASAHGRDKRALLDVALESYRCLAQEAQLMIVEGAGSPAETNLRKNDIANMGLAQALGLARRARRGYQSRTRDCFAGWRARGVGRG